MNEVTHTNTANLNQHLPDFLNRVTHNHDVISVSTQQGNVILVREDYFRQLEKEAKNAAYLKKIDESYEQLRRGEVIVKTMDELRAMEDE